MPFDSLTTHFATNGIAIIEYALVPADIERMAAAFTDTSARGGARQSSIPGGLLDWLIEHPVLCELARSLSGPQARLVRVLAFDKSPAANWFVPWHQDRSIAVQARFECDGYSNWTIRDGQIQVEPPIAILETMVALRIHLDDCGDDNGPLEAVLGSHVAGRLDRDAVAAAADNGRRMLCLADRGDILAMRPLIVHRSQKAKASSRRRVLHLEYANMPLARGLIWALPYSFAAQ
jgi:hypothetical protein